MKAEGDFSYEDITGQDHQHQKKTQRQNIKNQMEKDKWMRCPETFDSVTRDDEIAVDVPFA